MHSFLSVAYCDTGTTTNKTMLLFSTKQEASFMVSSFVLTFLIVISLLLIDLEGVQSFSIGQHNNNIRRIGGNSLLQQERLAPFSNTATSYPKSPATSNKRASTTTAINMALNDEMLDKVLEVAIDASKQAGEIIIGNKGGAAVSERKANSRDLLTLIDPLCEKVRPCVRVDVWVGPSH